MRLIKGLSIDDVWLQCCENIRTQPLQAPRGMTTQEFEGPVCIEIIDIRRNLLTNPYRGLNYAFAIAECLHIWRGADDVESLAFYNKQMRHYSDDGKTFSGAYGPLFSKQRTYLYNTLKNDTNTRQATITFWRPSPGVSKDIPCTIALHFMVRDFKLNLTVYMRSNDLWLGTPYDVFNFTTIQQQIAADLNYGLGTYHHIVGSLHVYSQNFIDLNWVHTEVNPAGIIMPSPQTEDLQLLNAFELCIRKPPKIQGRAQVEFNMSEFVRKNEALLYAYAAKKRGEQSIFPEPYATLREHSRAIQAYFGDSEDKGQTP